MPGGEFYLYSIVEGHGEEISLPKLLHKIWGKAHTHLRTDEKPYRVPKGKFLNNKESRRKALNYVREIAQDSGKIGVLILMDADDDCCQELLNNEMRAADDDINRILGGIPKVVVLIEEEYESWITAGLGGGKGDGKLFLKKYLKGAYRETKDQVGLIGKMDIEQTAEKNLSFRRFRERLLKWRGGG